MIGALSLERAQLERVGAGWSRAELARVVFARMIENYTRLAVVPLCAVGRRGMSCRGATRAAGAAYGVWPPTTEGTQITGSHAINQLALKGYDDHSYDQSLRYCRWSALRLFQHGQLIKRHWISVSKILMVTYI